MSKKNNGNSKLSDGRYLLSRYGGHITRSGLVTDALRRLPQGRELYEMIQDSEVELQAAKQNWESMAAAYATARDSQEILRRHILNLCRAGVSISEQEAIPGLREILVYDVNDEASMAGRIAARLKSSKLGSSLAATLESLRVDLVAKETAVAGLFGELELATRSLGHLFLRAESVVIAGQAVLYKEGIKIAVKKAPKKKVTPSQPTGVLAAA